MISENIKRISMIKRNFIKASFGAFLFLLGSVGFLKAQHQLVEKSYDCSDFHKENCVPSELEDFKVNGQSKSAVFRMGQTSELNIVAYSGHDYRLAICRDEIFKKEVRMKLKTKHGEVLYDNKTNDFAQIFEFSCTETQSMVIELSAPGGEAVAEGVETGALGCIGVLIEHMPTPDTGF